MASHNEVGQKAEDLAAKWLERQGYRIMQRNWRLSHYEIDIIAAKDKFIHFIEVKARHHSPYGHPEDSVGKQKFKSLQRAVDYYLLLNPGHEWIQYDILAITFYKNKGEEYFLLEDVYL
jgi:putative endonuclease